MNTTSGLTTSAVRVRIPADAVACNCLQCGEKIYIVRSAGVPISVEAVGDRRGQKHTLCVRSKR